jgi:hypothetical protein
MLMPLAGEVVCLLPEGPKAYWRGRITQVQCNQIVLQCWRFNML